MKIIKTRDGEEVALFSQEVLKDLVLLAEVPSTKFDQFETDISWVAWDYKDSRVLQAEPAPAKMRSHLANVATAAKRLHTLLNLSGPNAAFVSYLRSELIERRLTFDVQNDEAEAKPSLEDRWTANEKWIFDFCRSCRLVNKLADQATANYPKRDRKKESNFALQWLIEDLLEIWFKYTRKKPTMAYNYSSGYSEGRVIEFISKVLSAIREIGIIGGKDIAISSHAIRKRINQSNFMSQRRGKNESASAKQAK